MDVDLFGPDLSAAEIFEQCVAHVPVGVALLDTRRRYVHVNPAFAALDAIPPADHVGRTPSELRAPLATELEALLEAALERGESVIDRRISAEGAGAGQTGAWTATCHPLRDQAGRVAGAVALVLEAAADRDAADALLLTEQRLRLALEDADTGLWEWDIRRDRIHWSDSLGPLHGLPRGAQPEGYQSYLAKSVRPEDREALDAKVRHALATGEGYTHESQVALPDGGVRWLLARAHVVRGEDGEPEFLLGLSTDITERREREDAAAFLSQSSAALAQSLDPLETLQEIAQLAVPTLGDWCSVQLAAEGGGIRTLAVAHVDPDRARWARELETRYPPDPTQTTGTAQVMRSGRSELYPSIDDELLVAGARDEEHLALLREVALRSVMIVPMIARGTTVGAITFVYAESGRHYGTRELELAEELGRRSGLALDHARLYDRQQRIAETLQRALLPRALPSIRGYDLAAAYLPGTDGEDVGGDWYDAFALAGGRYGVVIGDIGGRGVEAAATMGVLRNALRAYATFGSEPGRTIDHLRRQIELQGGVEFATVLYVVIDPGSGVARAAGAGHLPPLLVDADGCNHYVEMGSSPPLGAPSAVACPTADLTLDPGATLVLYTDGLVEDRREGVEPGQARLAAVAGRGGELERMVSSIVDELVADRREDDVALLALRRRASKS